MKLLLPPIFMKGIQYMSDSKKQQQRDMRIRQDKIDLIKAKQGLSEQKLPLKEEKPQLTKQERVQNFWYYHKFKIIIGVVLVALVGFLVYSLSTVVHPDYSILFLTPDYEVGSRFQEIETKLQKYGRDINEDGQVVVRVNYLPLSKDFDNNATLATEYSANFSRALAEFQDGNCVIVIADEKVAKEQSLNTSLDNMMNLIPDNDKVKPLGFYFKDTEFTKEINGESLPDTVFIGIRKMIYEKRFTKKMQKNYDAGLEFIKNMVEDLT